MSEQDRITKLERQLQQALKRIGELENKTDTMRANINTNLSRHAEVLLKVCKDGGHSSQHIQTAIDVAMSQ